MRFKESFDYSLDDFKTIDLSTYKKDKANEKEEDEVAWNDNKWQTILFLGDYNPITITEYHRVMNFTLKYVKDNADDFADNVKIALLADIPEKKKYSLSSDDINFINTKLYGLKTYFIDSNALLDCILDCNTSDTEKRLDQNMLNIIHDLKKSFMNDNILFVVPTINDRDIPNEIQKFTHGESQYGYQVFDKESEYIGDNMHRYDITGNMIKATVLLDEFRPEPSSLKSFVNDTDLSDEFNMVQRLQIKSDNENYLDIFKQIFPPLNTSRMIDDTTLTANYKVIMDILKQMYKNN